jgi:RimJ/RimL family protein N-acetyltransferase
MNFKNNQPTSIMKIQIRQLTSADAPRLAEIANNTNVAKNLRDDFPQPYRLKDAVNFIKMQSQNKTMHVFGIECDGIYIGNVGVFLGADVYRKTAEIGYFLAEDYWGRGIMKNAIEQIVNYAFSNLDIVKISAGVFEFNTASMKVLEKAGFEKEVVLKSAVFKEGKICDEHRYCLIR